MKGWRNSQVNTHQRGRTVCTEDLITGIRDHKFWAVGLDVYEEESDFCV